MRCTRSGVWWRGVQVVGIIVCIAGCSPGKTSQETIAKLETQAQETMRAIEDGQRHATDTIVSKKLSPEAKAFVERAARSDSEVVQQAAARVMAAAGQIGGEAKAWARQMAQQLVATTTGEAQVFWDILSDKLNEPSGKTAADGTEDGKAEGTAGTSNATPLSTSSVAPSTDSSSTSGKVGVERLKTDAYREANAGATGKN